MNILVRQSAVSNFVDDAVNIRGLKRYAADHCGLVPPPECCEPTGKTVAIIGGGPSGLSAAYYLQQMDISVLFSNREKNSAECFTMVFLTTVSQKSVLLKYSEHSCYNGVETKMNTCIGDGDEEISFK